jgi:ubiquinone/menaquinone biosynthesis C-methylase UbiE
VIDNIVTDADINWDEFYSRPITAIQQLIDHAVCGCSFHGSSWMSEQEATELATKMKLGACSHLLDIGSGSGWPALFQTQKTGCSVTLTDISHQGLIGAATKARDTGVSARCHVVHTGAQRLPFKTASFDAIGHADVLCCLEEKLEALAECRRVIQQRGVMAFSVLHMRPGAGVDEIALAAAAGPSLISAPSDYPGMLQQTGWELETCQDITSGYAAILDKLLDEYEQHASSICAQHGTEHYHDMHENCLRKRRVVAAGSVRRSLFTAHPHH